MAGRLTLVGTPIGNLSDFSPRAVEALRACDFVAAEDTRVTLRLLNHFEIKKPLVSYFEHNKRPEGRADLRPPGGRGIRRPGQRRGDARHLGSGGGSGGALLRKGDPGGRGAGAERGGHGAGCVGPALRPLHL